MQLIQLLEDLDDKDDFGTICPWFGCGERPDSETLHRAHIAAEFAADKAMRGSQDKENWHRRWQSQNFNASMDIWRPLFIKEMAKYGYAPVYGIDNRVTNYVKI